MVSPTRARLGHKAFEFFKELVYEETGISLGPEKRYLLEARLQKRLSEFEFDQFDSYIQWLKSREHSRDEIDLLIETVTVGETSFFRHAAHFRILKEIVFPALAAGLPRKDNTLRLWSAGCSTGEEAYSLAMAFFETGLPSRGWRIKVFATDISRNSIRHAQGGVYKLSSFKNTPDVYTQKYFSRKDDQFILRPDIRTAVTFSRMNLLEVRKVRLLPSMDVVFCRNVLMYFDAKSRKSGMDLIMDRLRPGGYLFLGHQETLHSKHPQIRSEDIGSVLVYRRLVDGHD
ncbi:MAG: protein-glutamate O-methyltransferase CheR [Nitrospirae bacterium]|nr:protein-glutamate O-methyltransferase CheR [Nitrospirota bacterium]